MLEDPRKNGKSALLPNHPPHPLWRRGKPTTAGRSGIEVTGSHVVLHPDPTLLLWEKENDTSNKNPGSGSNLRQMSLLQQNVASTFVWKEQQPRRTFTARIAERR